MGWAKYHEDNNEIWIDNNSNRYYMAVDNPDKSKKSPIYNCSYCNLSFNSKKELYNHIRTKHNIISSLLIINGKVVNSECFVKELKSALIIRCDFQTNVYINNQFIDYGEDNEIDITSIINRNLELKNKTTIIIGEKNYTISLISRETIDINKIDSVINKWSDESSKGLHIEKGKYYSNDVEKQCFNGLYNYFLACVSSGKDKDRRYEDAYAILTEVADILPVATFLLKIISFRLNWVEKLRTLCIDHDIFSQVCNFFLGIKEKNAFRFEGDKRIFIEDELEKILKVIVAYQVGDNDIVESFLNNYSLHSISDISDTNYRDKIYLLLARISIRNKKFSDARRYYLEIQTPFFDREKNNYIKGM